MDDLFTPQTLHHVDAEIAQGSNLYWPTGALAKQLAITGPTVARSTAYAVGDRVTPLAPNGYAYECATAGTSHASTEPSWPTVVGKTVSDGTATWRCAGTVTDRVYLVDTTGYSAVMEIRQGSFDGATQLECSTANGRITVGFEPPKWVVATAYGVGQQVVPTLLNGYVYQCTVAGTSHASTEPAWPTALGATVSDGTARWRCEQAEDIGNGLVNNLVVNAGPAVTAALADWGMGLYVLKLLDPFGNVALWVDGTIYLRRDTNY
jgi:D-tyrosyl-tRNA(Tyr) deacylase